MADLPSTNWTSNPNYRTWGPTAWVSAANANVDPQIFTSLINSESGFNPSAYNQSGATGIAQFMPDTASSLGVDPNNPYSALDGAASYLSTLLDKYGGDYGKAVAAYKGYGSDVANGTDPMSIPNVAKVFNDIGRTPSKSSNSTQIPDKPLWQFSWDDWKTLFRAAALGMSIGTVGFAMILLGVVAIYLNREKLAVQTILKGS